MFVLTPGKPVWYLPLALLAISFLLYSSIGFWFGQHGSGNSIRHPDSLLAIFSPNTIDALNEDPRLRGAVLSLAEAIAQSSTDLGERLRYQSLKDFGANLTDGVAHVRTKQHTELKRRTMDDMSTAWRSLMGNDTGGTNLTSGLSGILKGLTDSMGTSALFLGIGLGMGTSTALNLTDMQEASMIASRIATAYNVSATGANLAAENFGSGLAGEIAPFLKNSNASLALATYALASGIGNATAAGLGLTQKQFAPSNDINIESVAGNLGLGVATPIVSNIDIKMVMQSLRDSIGTSGLIGQLPEIASAAGMGLGEGARKGLGLTASEPSVLIQQKRQLTNNTPDFSGAIGSFAEGLSQSFIQGSNLTELGLAVGTVFPNMIDFQTMLRPIAAGAGAGVGMGVAIGLNFKPANATPTFLGNVPYEEQQISLTAEGFMENMLSNFLTNSTAVQLTKDFLMDAPSRLLKDVNSAQAAEGLARGVVEGAMSAMSSVGGIKNLISGNISANALYKVPILAPSRFNDSVNGSAVGFARGLAGKATILIAEMAKNLTQTDEDTHATKQTSQPKHGLQDRSEEAGVVSRRSLSTREAKEDASSQFPIAIDAGTAEKGAQFLVDTITCQGIGGIASAAFGAMSAAKARESMMNISLGVPLDPTVLQALPRGPMNLSSDGNIFEVSIENQSVHINGIAFVPFAVITALHILFAGLAFLALLPIYLILGVVWRFSDLFGYPVDEAKNVKWRMGLLIAFEILGIVGIVLGFVGMGKATHFRDTHGIMGLICLILLLPAVGFSLGRLRTALPDPPSSAFAGIKGPIALAKTPQRIYLVSGLLMQLLLGVGQFTVLQGFATLRSISLCVVDAVLTSASVVGIVSLLITIQVSATGLLGFRVWVEQHIAKNQTAGVQRTMAMKGHTRTATMATFGFEKDMITTVEEVRPPIASRSTEKLRGYEDVAISAPFNIRKEGSINEMPIVQTPQPRQDPFLSSEERENYEARGIFNPRTRGSTPTLLEENADSIIEYNAKTTAYPVENDSSSYFNPRPLVADMPALDPYTSNYPSNEQDQSRPSALPIYMTQKSTASSNYSYSRPFDRQREETTMDSFMGFEPVGEYEGGGYSGGFGKGPGGTIKEKRDDRI